MIHQTVNTISYVLEHWRRVRWTAIFGRRKGTLLVPDDESVGLQLLHTLVKYKRNVIIGQENNGNNGDGKANIMAKQKTDEMFPFQHDEETLVGRLTRSQSDVSYYMC